MGLLVVDMIQEAAFEAFNQKVTYKGKYHKF